ncbi:unnamed protein product [Caenorhabditis sp. 36 PRJEB53466]|nr:unnamed protein product [Caenorhabditis sp. 36 PRJEB53466]
MDEVRKYGKTLDEIEGELMFGEFPESLIDSDEEHNIFDDEFDAANDETFGGGLDNIGENAELENYATQTQRLRLDDPVWQNPSSSEPVAPNASTIPIPYSMFGNAFKSSFEAESPFLKKSIWGNGTDNFNIWGSDFGLTSTPVAPSYDIDLRSLRPAASTPAPVKSEPKSSQIPAMPSSALTLEDIERMQTRDTADVLAESFKGLNIITSVEPQSMLPSQFQSREIEITETQASGGLPLHPTLPASALSLEELERKMVQESQSAAAQKPRRPQLAQAQEPSPGQERFSHPPPVFHSNMPSRTMSPMVLPIGAGMPMNPPMGFPPQLGPMMPPPNMLPKLPPLNPQFLPLIPAWLNAIIHNVQLPIGVPPPPPFLFQLLNHYRNPQLVHAMIVRSSIPPNVRPNGPQFGLQQGQHSPGNRIQRKHSGMPSTRTIYDLALDSFAGYMSYKEREWLIRIQFVQCKGSGDPFLDDYYYVTWREKQIANGWTAEPKSEQPKVQEFESQKDYLERIRRMNYREKQKERARERDKERQRERQERIDRGEERKPRQTLSDKFATSLGLPSKSSTHNPRHVLDMKRQVDSVDQKQAKKMSDEERKIAVAKKLRTMLLRLEGALTLLIEIDELRKPNLSEKSQFRDLSSEQKDQEVEKRTSLIINELMGDDLSKLMQMSKGRAVITRTLKVVGPKEQATIVLALMSAGSLVSKKLYGEIVLDVLPVAFSKIASLHPEQFEFLVRALNLDNLKRQLLDNNVFVRDMMLTLFFVSVKNRQKLVEWAKETKFTSLKMPSSAPLNYWRRALNVISDNDIKEFSDQIKYSGIVDCHDVATLIQQST